MKEVKKIKPLKIAALFCMLLFSSLTAVTGQSVEKTLPDTSYFKPGRPDHNLLEAILKNDHAAVKIALEQGADPNAKSNTGNSALMFAAGSGNMQNIMLLVERGADVNFKGLNGETPLFTAIFNNNFEVAKYLLEQGADPNVKDDYGVTPLIYAAATNQYQSADLLLFYEADHEILDSKGNDPLIAAVTFEHLETSDVLLQNGLNPNVQDKKGNTPLIVATQHGTYDIMDLLMDYNADANLANNKNYTALAYAVVYEDTLAMNMLLEGGADIHHQISKGRNITELARIAGNRDVIDLVESRGGKQLKQPDFSEFHFTTGHSFNGTDYLVQFRGSLADSKYGFYFETGVDYRPFLLRFQLTENDTLFQYRERRIGWSHGAGKHFTLYRSAQNIRYSAYAAVHGLLSFPRYMGSSRGPSIDYTLIPGAGLAVTGNYAGLKAGMEWYKFGNRLENGLKFNISIFFRIVQPEDHFDRKEIYWE